MLPTSAVTVPGTEGVTVTAPPPPGGSVPIGGVTPPGREGTVGCVGVIVSPPGGRVPIGGVTPPGTVGVMPVTGGRVPIGGVTPPGTVGVMPVTGEQGPDRRRDATRHRWRNAGDRRQGPDRRGDATRHGRGNAGDRRQGPDRRRDAARHGWRNAGDRRQPADRRRHATGQSRHDARRWLRQRPDGWGPRPPATLASASKSPETACRSGDDQAWRLEVGEGDMWRSVIPAFWFWVSSRQSLLPVVS